MVMERRGLVVDKRAQSEEGISKMVLAVLFLFLMAGVIYFVFNFINGVGDNAPKQQEVIIQFCGKYSSEPLKSTYCTQVRKLGRNKYVTCDYAASVEGFDIDGSEKMKSICSGMRSGKNYKEVTDESYVRAIILGAEEGNIRESAVINGVTYAEWKKKQEEIDTTESSNVCSGDVGTPTSATTCPFGQTQVTGVGGLNAGQICCKTDN